MPASSISPEMTIRDVEETIGDIFDRIRNTPSLTPEQALSIVDQLRVYFAPSGYRTIVQLEEDGRKKRSTASAKSWQFETGEMVLYFETSTMPRATDAAAQKMSAGAYVVQMPTPNQVEATSVSSSAKLEVQQCCEALAEAEKAGKQFIALKWFRDLVLAGLPYSWAQSEEERQRVLSAAIDSGAILVKRIPNPRSPMHPTTTILLNKTSSVVAIPSRFKPIPVQGESISATLLKDRGQH